MSNKIMVAVESSDGADRALAHAVDQTKHTNAMQVWCWLAVLIGRPAVSLRLVVSCFARIDSGEIVKVK